MVQDEGDDVIPPLKNDQRGTGCALILPGFGILRAHEVEKWPHRAIPGPQLEYGGSSGPSHHNPLRLGLASRDGSECRRIGGFGAGDAGIDARLRVELERQLRDERDQHISRRGSHCSIRRSARLRLDIERIRARATVYRIERIVDGDVHHRVDARFVEWVVERSEAGRGGSHTGVCVPDSDGIAAGGSEGPLTFRSPVPQPCDSNQRRQ